MVTESLIISYFVKLLIAGLYFKVSLGLTPCEVVDHLVQITAGGVDYI